MAVTEERLYDIAIIGGGINGAAIAHRAALSGLAVVLLEKGDFASGTSSRSSRLIHGGVRYLEHGELKLVFESSRERRVLARLAPHLVRPLAFTWPVYRGARLPRWKLRAGLTAYDVLSLYRNFASHRGLRREDVIALEPALKTAELLGGASYFDAMTEDARLTIANVVAAAARGAVVRNYSEVTGMEAEGGHALLHARDELSGDSTSWRAKLIVNATGPWSDALARILQAEHRRTVRGSKGAHIAVPRERLGNRSALTLLSPRDGRVFFVLPGQSTSIIGTTDTETDEAPDDVRATMADIEYLLEAANHYFPLARLTADDVVSAWAGIRPLAAVHFTGDTVSSSREHELRWWNDLTLSVAGGKLTTYRVVAREVVSLLLRKLGRPRSAAYAAETLPGGDIGSLEAESARAAEVCGDAVMGAHLARSFGSRWTEVWRLAELDQALREPLWPGHSYIRAEVVHAAREELARTIGDVLIRRTQLAFETRDHGRGAAAGAAELLAAELRWSASETQSQLARFEQEVERLFGSHAAQPSAAP